VHLMVLC